MSRLHSCANPTVLLLCLLLSSHWTQETLANLVFASSASSASASSSTASSRPSRDAPFPHVKPPALSIDPLPREPLKSHLWRWANPDCLGEPLLANLSWPILSNDSSSCVELFGQHENVVGYIRAPNGDTCRHSQITGVSWNVSLHSDPKCSDSNGYVESLEVGRCVKQKGAKGTSYFASCAGPPRAQLLPAFVSLKWTYDVCPWSSPIVRWFQFDTFKNVAHKCVPWHGPTFRGQFAYMRSTCDGSGENVTFSLFRDSKCTSFNANVTVPMGDACDWNGIRRPRTVCFVPPPMKSDDGWNTGGLSGGAIAGIVIAALILVFVVVSLIIARYNDKTAPTTSSVSMEPPTGTQVMPDSFGDLERPVKTGMEPSPGTQVAMMPMHHRRSENQIPSQAPSARLDD